MNKIYKSQTGFLHFSLTMLFVMIAYFNHGQGVYLVNISNNEAIPEKRYRSQVFDSITVNKDILFTKVKNNEDSLLNLKLDVYQPFEDDQKNRPVILWVHGGGFRSGTKEQGYIVKLARTFAERGYVSVSTDYRLRKNPGEDMKGTINEAVSDVIKAFSWIKTNSKELGINKKQIIIGGGSAGGILSTNLCFLDSETNSEWNKDGLIAFVNLWGSPDKKRVYIKLDKNDPPSILIHGTEDKTVPYKNCQWLSNELHKAGAKCEVFSIEGAGHTPVEHLDEIVEKVSDFLYEILSPVKKE